MVKSIISLYSYMQKGRLEAGCDEAGRGCLAGPVCAAAVVLPDGFHHPKLNDSKQMTDATRRELRPVIENHAVAWAVAMVEHHEIDKINILNASILAMHRALAKLKTQPDFILVDGHRFMPYENVDYECIIKGDGKYMSIAAASVLAKTYRDDFMVDLHHQYPYYGWDSNKGYPTKKHRKAIVEHGVTPFHRMSFRLLDQQQKIQFPNL